MKKRDLQNNELERLESSLFKAAKMSDEELETIVADPHLFGSIKAQIEAEENQMSLKPERSAYGWLWLKTAFADRRAAFGTFAALLVFAAFAFILTFETSTPVAKKEFKAADQAEKFSALSVPEKNSEEADKDSLVEKGTVSGNKDSKPEYVKKENPVKPRKISANSPKKSNREIKRKILKPNPSETAKREEQKVFYTLPFNENKPVESEDLQIVRTELSRSELFALGVNLQLENGTSKIKTELLVGLDGVARAIRVVEEF